MKTVVIITSLITFIWIEFLAVYQGFDLRKQSSWLYGVLGFLCGLAMGFALSSNLIESLKVGGIFAFMVLFVGATMRRNNQKSKDMAKSLLKQYRDEENPSLFTKLVKKLLGKYE